MAQSRRHFRDNERGQALVQYAMLIALVGASLVFILGIIGNAARNAYSHSETSLEESRRGQSGGGSGGGGGGLILTGSSGGGHPGPAPTVPQADSAASGEADDSTGVTNTASR